MEPTDTWYEEKHCYYSLKFFINFKVSKTIIIYRADIEINAYEYNKPLVKSTSVCDKPLVKSTSVCDKPLVKSTSVCDEPLVKSTSASKAASRTSIKLPGTQ